MMFRCISASTENETSSVRLLACQPKTKALLKHTTPNSWDYKKILSSNKCFLITQEDFYFPSFNHNVSRFSHKQNSKMIDFWALCQTQKAPAQAAYRDSGFARKTNDLGQPPIRNYPASIPRFPHPLSPA